ncbi:type II secretion system F family protein [Candidatus Woesearchaeota archaeon]|nr:type II secretion system F family protein [Candidatus Woesearchaeota archaeon]
MPDAKELLREAAELARELEVYKGYKENLLSHKKKLYRQYQAKKFGYLEYQRRLKELLKDRDEGQWTNYYNSYIYWLLKRIEFLLSETFYLVQKDDSYKGLRIASPAAKAKPTFQLRIPNPARLLQPKVKVFDLDSELEIIQATAIPAKPAPSKQATQKIGLEPKVAELKKRIASYEQKPRQAATPAVPQDKSFLEKFLEAANQPLQLPRIRLPFGKPRIAPEPSATAVKPVSKHAAQPTEQPGQPEAAKPAALTIAKPRQARYLPAKGQARPSPGLFTRVLQRLTPMRQAKPEGPHSHTVSFMERIRRAIQPRGGDIFTEEIVGMEKGKGQEAEAKAEGKGAVVGWFSGARVIREAFRKELLGRLQRKRGGVIGEKTSVPAQMRRLMEMRERLAAEEKIGPAEATLLVKEAKRIKKILEAQKKEAYRGSTIGIIANITAKRLSLYLVDRFPEFFGYLYNALRAANIRILSNTYVNIMLLSTITVALASTIVLMPVFFILNYAIYEIVFRALLFGALAGVMCAAMFYAYPFMRIKERRRSITTNMPFAINHMAAVATSGVPPSVMFELISSSEEYGEVAVEIKKIVDFINIFGYDLLTAMRSVATTTPSPAMKDFMDGMVSTIETGGNLESFLRQKADEATLVYQLERQRYNQSIATYSDIYTGLLIAAPLFFVAALALVNILGGKIGGLGVDVIMALGAYVLIPVLNAAFLLFLQVSQPEA